MPTQIYTLRGMDCADCALKIEKGVRLLEGVHNARVDFATAKLKIEGDISTAAIRQRVEALGYKLDEPTAQPARRAGGLIGFGQYLWERSETRPALAGGAIILLTLLASRLGLPPAAARGLWIGALAAAGYPIARSGLSALLINRDFNINLLMTLAAIGAVVIGEPLEAATLIFLFALAEALEGYTTDRARDSLRGLMELAPARAVRLGRDKDAGREETVPVEALQVGDTILIRPGERTPMDGVITVGASEVNQAPITGESLPVQKVVGDEVFAGTVNGSGALEARVTHLAQDNTLSRIIRLVEEAQSVRAPAQRRIDQFARVYTPATVGAAVLVAALPPLLFGQPFWDTPVERGWLYRALALFVIACPCALVISAPVTVISALTSAARRGVLIKGGAHLETLAQVKAFAFDKTGTLTLGEPVVTQARAVDCAAGGECEQCNDVLALASALERRSAHPLARSVVAAAEQRGVAGAYAAAENVEALAGRGLQGWVNGKRVTLGHHRLFDDEHPHDEAFCQLMDEAEARGQTVMAVCDGNRVRGFIALADAVRPDSAAALSALHALDCRTIMLTGDNATAARAAARQVGVRDVRAGLLPEDKSDAVRALRDEFGCVAMVGDGINDTPALAAANVGVAVGGAASAQAIEAADVVLMADGLRRLPFAVRLSRFARRLIAQNISLSLITKAVFMLLALAGLTSLWLAILGDMGVSLLVTVNGMRPLRFEREA